MWSGDAPLERELLVMSLRDPEVRKLRAEFEEMGLEILTSLITLVIPRTRIAHARAAATVVQIASLEVAVERADLRPRFGARVSDKEIKAALADMVFRYLFTDGAKAGPPAPPVRSTPAPSTRTARRGRPARAAPDSSDGSGKKRGRIPRR